MGKILIFGNQFFNWFFISATGYYYIDFVKLILNTEELITTSIQNIGTILIVIGTLLYWGIKGYNEWLDHKFRKKEREHKQQMMDYEKNKRELLTDEDIRTFLNTK